jgi:putative endonuclease
MWGSLRPLVMAGLVPAIHVFHHPLVAGGYVYILPSGPNGILYVGVTNEIVRRIYEHRNGLVPGFTRKYSIHRLVYFERYKDIQTATQREKNMKHWPRAWKIKLILAANPEWNDLYDSIVQ